MDHLLYMKDLSDNEKLLFLNEFNNTKKSTAAGVLFALFLGGVGAHHYYLGNIGLGITYTIFFWTWIPALIALIECFLMSGRVKKFNDNKMQEISLKIKSMRPTPESVPA